MKIAIGRLGYGYTNQRLFKGGSYMSGAKKSEKFAKVIAVNKSLNLSTRWQLAAEP
jgi:hypothetical protein